MEEALERDKDDRRVVMSEVMTPEKANFAGNIHGGHLLNMLDRVAYACAARYCGHYVVTLSVDGVVFKEPIHVAELVTCFASINYVGNTSMDIGIRVIAENLRNRTRRHTNSCYFTMIAVDENLKPTKIKSLELRTPDEVRRFEDAKLRREIRSKYAEEHKQRKNELGRDFRTSGD